MQARRIRNWAIGSVARLGAVARGLWRDRGGNALAITGASIMLLMALAGSGTDMARAYMTRTSLQNACDAGVLAGRKAMSTSGTYGTTEKAKATKMFNFNMNPLATQATNIVFSSSANDTGQVNATATADMPMTLMKFFGFRKVSMAVNCSAELQMASADVVFVLDVTGSMRYDPDGVGCCDLSTSKLNGLRDAIRDFYKTVAAAVTDKTHTRIRFAFVPYSSNVNVKDLVSSGAMPTSYFQDSTTYRTRVANFNTPVYAANTPTVAAPVNETNGSAISASSCNSWSGNNGTNPASGGGPQPTATTSTAYAKVSWTKTGRVSGTDVGTCVRSRTVTTTTYRTLYRFTNYSYPQTSIDVSAYKGLGSVTLSGSLSTGSSTPASVVPTSGTYNRLQLGALAGTTDVSNVPTSTDTWDGCIEERATVQSLSMSPIPSGATDLDLTNAPSSEATKWRLYLPELEYAGYSSPRTEYCPAPMKLLTEVDTTAPTTVPSWIETFLTSLQGVGGTYHDIGMIWGGRVGNPNGIFRTNVNEDSTTYPSVSRHVIFMTDGIMSPYNTVYTAYGWEDDDHRVAPAGQTDGFDDPTTGGTLANYHNARFLAACQQVKQMGYTIWLIGFGQSLTTQMQSCSTGNRAYFAGNTTTLKNTFKFIAGQVADLRINK